MKKWKVEVIADNSGKWCGNALVYESYSEAEEEAKSLAYRWTSVRQARVVEFEGEKVFNTTVVFG